MEIKTFKTLKTLCAVSLIAFGSYFGYNAYEKATMSEAERFFQANVEALTEIEGNPSNYQDCLRNGGNWNMASICEDSGFETATCKINGSISIFGVTISGSFEKGKKYSIPWARYKCVMSTSNCCVKQGLYTGEVKLA